ncbi:hypothetical protein OsI_36678 [Oryza sativa Indica Group]|uniref:Uncharacterized protein n=1 Tax=Oryza sativa subsp. indica TaxID=39946 RepID=B8BLB8_ORYSI|nr:hypothetical protein OsI_36678 [Oryza sativa Indica Group]
MAGKKMLSRIYNKGGCVSEQFTCNNKPNLTLKLCYDTVLPGKFVDDLYLMTSKNRTSGLDWSGGCENQVELSEVLVGIAHPLDIKLLCKGVHSSANYSLTSMISYADGRYICFARDQDKWLSSDAKTVETKDSWEQLLERFRDCTLQPEVLFFEVIK